MAWSSAIHTALVSPRLQAPLRKARAARFASGVSSSLCSRGVSVETG